MQKPSHSNLLHIPPFMLLLISQYVNIAGFGYVSFCMLTYKFKRHGRAICLFSSRNTSTSYFLARQPGCPALPMSTVSSWNMQSLGTQTSVNIVNKCPGSSSVCPYYCALPWRTHSGILRAHLSVSPLCPHGKLHMCVSLPRV